VEGSRVTPAVLAVLSTGSCSSAIVLSTSLLELLTRMNFPLRSSCRQKHRCAHCGGAHTMHWRHA
jgi:ferredoxin